MKAQGKTFKNSVEFLNCTKDVLESENNGIPTYESTSKEEPVFHPSLITNIPGVVLEEIVQDFAEVILETPAPTLEERANDALENAGL